MPDTSVIGCLLDVSASMQATLETGSGDQRAVERLRAVIRAAIQLARAEQKHDPDAVLFVGVFGLDTQQGCPASIDLCSAIEGALAGDGTDEGLDGHQLLIRLANRRNRAHIKRYIQTNLKEHEARIIHSYLQRHPDAIDAFAAAIPDSDAAAFGIGAAQNAADFGSFLGFNGLSEFMDRQTEDSDAMRMARRICKEWLNDYAQFTPRKIDAVVRLLEKMDAQMDNGLGGRRTTLLDDLRSYMYGNTPMRESITKASVVFAGRTASRQQVLVLISDGQSTDGDPTPVATQLKSRGVDVATIFLTNQSHYAQKRLYDTPAQNWDSGQRTLFNMASRVSGAAHPIPVLTSLGWVVPSSGECGLYAAVCSTDALEEFCIMLLSARFGSADALLDILGKVNTDSFVNDEHVSVCRNPSNQGDEGVCYAHAVAAAAHMALIRIVDREGGGCPSIATIRNRILQSFPARPGGQSTIRALAEVARWYRPLRFNEVDEGGARQAILRRRPVLTTFRLSKAGWKVFAQHFGQSSHRGRDCRIETLTLAKMQQQQQQQQQQLIQNRPGDGDDGGGHAVVLTGCDPQSLVFLNSWNDTWGNHGSFSVENARVLARPPDVVAARFFDVFWFEGDLTPGERAAYDRKADAAVQGHAAEHPSLFGFESVCPLCRVASPIASFTGSIRRAVCPRCRRSFAPEPGQLVRALYIKAGLGEV